MVARLAVQAGHASSCCIAVAAAMQPIKGLLRQEAGGFERSSAMPLQGPGQARARRHGFEIQGTVSLAQIGDMVLAADGLVDPVRTSVCQGQPRAARSAAAGAGGLFSRLSPEVLAQKADQSQGIGIGQPVVDRGVFAPGQDKAAFAHPRQML